MTKTVFDLAHCRCGPWLKDWGSITPESSAHLRWEVVATGSGAVVPGWCVERAHMGLGLHHIC